MAVVYLSPIGNSVIPFLNANGAPNANGFLSTFLAGTSTPSATYTTSAGSVQNAVSIPLGPDGRVPNEVWLVTAITYKFVLLDSTGTLIPGCTYDNITGINDPTYLIYNAKGDLIVGTANDAASILSVGANGTVPMARSVTTTALAYVAALNKAIYGFTYANNGANNLDIASGGAMDATGAYWITGAALTKQTNVSWAVGTNAGLLDTGAVGNNDYYLWAIARSDTGVTDYLGSLSSTAPTMPGGVYDFKRLIGWYKIAGGVVVAFHTYETEGGGLEFSWDVPSLDVNLSNTLTTTRRTDAVKAPLNFSVTAILGILTFDNSSAAVIWVTCPDHTDAAPVGPASANIVITSTVTLVHEIRIRTSSAGLIAARSSIATVDTYQVSTYGFTWARRN